MRMLLPLYFDGYVPVPFLVEYPILKYVLFRLDSKQQQVCLLTITIDTGYDITPAISSTTE